MQNDTFTFCLDECNGVKSSLKQKPWLDNFYKMTNETFYDGMKIELKHCEIVIEEIISASNFKRFSQSLEHFFFLQQVKTILVTKYRCLKYPLIYNFKMKKTLLKEQLLQNQEEWRMEISKLRPFLGPKFEDVKRRWKQDYSKKY